MVLGQERGTAGYRLGSTYLQEDGQLVQGDVRGDGAGAAQAGGGGGDGRGGGGGRGGGVVALLNQIWEEVDAAGEAVAVRVVWVWVLVGVGVRVGVVGAGRVGAAGPWGEPGEQGVVAVHHP